MMPLKKGDRVRLKEERRREFPQTDPERLGTITGFRDHGTAYSILWDGTKWPMPMAAFYVEKVK